MDDNDTLIVDVKVTVHSRDAYACKHFLETAGDSYADVVLNVLEEYARASATDVIVLDDVEDNNDPIKVEAIAMYGQITSIKCVGKPMELYQYLQRSNLSLKSLSSNTTPIFKNGLCINLASKQDKLPPTKPTQSLPSAIDIMMGTGEV